MFTRGRSKWSVDFIREKNKRERDDDDFCILNYRLTTLLTERLLLLLLPITNHCVVPGQGSLWDKVSEVCGFWKLSRFVFAVAGVELIPLNKKCTAP